MSKIHLLSETLISQIKAGEIVERPASALKEMMDNAIDSGAASIKASIEKGGLGCVSVEDDGEGIEAEDLPLAFARHATSKIKTFEDLSTATTMGFRGEALASLAAVSRCKIISKRSGSGAFEIEAEEGRVGTPSASARRDGTTVSARDLFFYVPARRKFLKSEPTESAHCREAFVRSALSRPDIAMSFLKDGKLVYNLPIQSALERAKALLGSCFSGPIAIVSSSFPPYSIHGFAAPLGALPSGKETQLLYVNKRFARDRLLTHAAKEALIQSRGLGREREVAFVLQLELPTELVDANAHPAKTEVRFKDPRTAHQFVFKALSEALAKLPPAPPLASSGQGLGAGAPRGDGQSEADIDLFGEAASSWRPQGTPLASRADVANETERFIGRLRGGYCAWDAGQGLWIAPEASLALVGPALALAAQAESGALAGEQQLIPARVDGLSDIQALLALRKSQIQALGLELEWGPGAQCSISFAPAGFDNCDWNSSLRAIAKNLALGKADALSLCLALSSGLPRSGIDDDALWTSASAWMGKRRLARELAGARFIDLAF